jgi:hypothetical protein
MSYILDISSAFNTPENNSFTEGFLRAYLRWAQHYLGTERTLYDRNELSHKEECQRIIVQIGGIPDETMTTLVAETGTHRIIDLNRRNSMVTVLCYPANGNPDPELKIEFRSARPGGGGGSPAGFQVSHPHWHESIGFPCPSKQKQASVKADILTIFTDARPNNLLMTRRFRLYAGECQHLSTGRSFDPDAFFDGRIEDDPEPVSEYQQLIDDGHDLGSVLDAFAEAFPEVNDVEIN